MRRKLTKMRPAGLPALLLLLSLVHSHAPAPRTPMGLKDEKARALFARAQLRPARAAGTAVPAAAPTPPAAATPPTLGRGMPPPQRPVPYSKYFKGLTQQPGHLKPMQRPAVPHQTHQTASRVDTRVPPKFVGSFGPQFSTGLHTPTAVSPDPRIWLDKPGGCVKVMWGTFWEICREGIQKYKVTLAERAGDMLLVIFSPFLTFFMRF